MERSGYRYDLIGKRFSRLVVLGEGARGTKRRWVCQCDCGKITFVATSSLTKGTVGSCGCLRRDNLTTHGHSRIGQISREYATWQSIKQRCYNPKDIAYKNYGGRGIRVCERWLNSFENFLADMGPRPTASHSIDRYPDNDGHYEPGNTRWATTKEQAQNKHRYRVKRKFSEAAKAKMKEIAKHRFHAK